MQEKKAAKAMNFGSTKTKFEGCLTELAGIAAMLAPGPASAYLGPGAGLGMVGSLIAIVVIAIVMLLGLVIYPVRMLRKRRTRASADQDKPEGSE